MKNQNIKQRLFEVMGKIDKSFKPKLVDYFSDMWAKDKFVIQLINAIPELRDKYSKYLNLDINGWNSLSDDELKHLWDEWNVDSSRINEIPNNNLEKYKGDVKNELIRLDSGEKVLQNLDRYSDFILNNFNRGFSAEHTGQAIRDHWYGV
jgi:hypothetical protein